MKTKVNSACTSENEYRLLDLEREAWDEVDACFGDRNHDNTRLDNLVVEIKELRHD